MSDEQVHPAAAHQARRGHRRRRRPRVRPHAFGRLHRQDRRAAQALAHLSRKPRRGDHVHLLPHQHGVARDDHRDRHLVVARGRRCGVEQAARDGRKRGSESHRGAIHRHRDRRGRHLVPALPHPHRTDHERAGTLGPERELARRRADRSAEPFDRHLGDLARAGDREAGEGRKHHGHGLGGAAAGAHGEAQLLTGREPRAVHARRDVRRRPLQRGQEPQRRDHQSFTPGSTARRM